MRAARANASSVALRSPRSWVCEILSGFSSQMRGAPVTSKVARDYTRVFLSGASQETPDKQGRVTVPQPLRDYAGLTKDCVVIGAGARLEVWDAQAWDTYLAANETAFAEQAEEVLPGLF